MSIYLDNAATTRVCPAAVAAALSAMTEEFGNPSALYPPGQRAKAALASHRADVAGGLGCFPEEVFFTSCGTEGNNWAIRCALAANRRVGKHIITSAIEHSAVLEPCRQLEREGYSVTYLKPDSTGHIDPDTLAAALQKDTALVSLMLVNNELGTLQPVAQAAEAIRAAGSSALLHTDAVQAFLKLPFTPAGLGVDFLTVSGHKVRAPKGVGALYVKKGRKLPPLLLGGGQEGGLRPGTEATAQIAAFAAACRDWKGEYRDHMAALRDYAVQTLCAVPGLRLVAEGDAPHILALTLPGYPSEMLVRDLADREVYVSSGSACHRGKPSHVFAALGLGKRDLMGVLRISFSPESTRADVDALREGLLHIQATRVAAG